MTRGGGKVNKDWIVRDYSNPDAIIADNLFYDSTTTIKEAIQLGHGGHNNYIREVEYFTLTVNDITHKYISLFHNPINIEIQFIIIGGVPQAYNVDFILKNNNLISWSSSDCSIGLESVLRVDDVIQIEYSRLP